MHNVGNEVKKRRAVVAMSGGIDSSVVAVMLKKQNYEVIGVTLQLFNYGDDSEKQTRTCCASRDISDASKVAEMFDFQHYVLNYEDVFKAEVIDKFVDSYVAGYTPIPCIQCNQTVKFRDLYKIAKNLDADFLATGHYVRKGMKGGKAELLAGVDSTKDQSYFLFQTTSEQLDFLEFPLGGMEKKEAREMAKEMGLEIHNKPDSQNICFVPDGNYAKVVERYSPESIRDGNIVHVETNKIIGTHKGTINFTIGQRKRINVSNPTPLFVVKIDTAENTVFVGDREHLDRNIFRIVDTNWLIGDSEKDSLEKLAKEGDYLTTKVRASQDNISCSICFKTNVITLKEMSQLLCRGQAAVFYVGDRMIGGGFIEEVMD